MDAFFRLHACARQDIDLFRDYAHPIGRIWNALTTPTRIEAWIGVQGLRISVIVAAGFTRWWPLISADRSQAGT